VDLGNKNDDVIYVERATYYMQRTHHRYDMPVWTTDCGAGAETEVKGTTMKLMLLYRTVHL
jgi:hypothetical protein